MCNTVSDTNKQLREALEELEKYKKAFKLACQELAEHDESPLCEKTPISTRGAIGVEEYFLEQRLQEERDDKQRS